LEKKFQIKVIEFGGGGGMKIGILKPYMELGCKTQDQPNFF